MSKIETLPTWTGLPSLEDILMINRANNPSAGLWKSEQITLAEFAEISPVWAEPVSIPSAEVLTLNSVPVELVAPAGAGKAIVPEKIIIRSAFNSTPYATNTKLIARIDTATDDLFDVAGGLEYNVTSNFRMHVIENNDKNEFIGNKGLILTVEGGEPTAGDSDLLVYILYSILNL
jgi:hypothetical protein